jgi:signal transduction histidine kinase/DNA-binding response OmpR family regulator
MRHWTLYAGLGLLLVLASTPRVEAARGGPLLDEFGRSQIGADGMAWTGLQLKDGRLLFGFDAVVEYDGTRWTSHAIPGSYAVRSIDAAADGRVWVAAMNEVGCLVPHDNGFEYQSLVERLPAELRGTLGDVWHALADGAGAVFVTKEHVLRWDGERFHTWHMPGGRRLAAFRFDGRVHVSHAPSGVYVMGGNGPELSIPASALDAASVMWMGTIGPHVVLATTARGLLRRNGEQLVPFASELTSWIQRNVLTGATTLPDGAAAIGTLHGGISVVDAHGNLRRRFELGVELPADPVYSLFVDREGFLWVVMPSRVLRLSPDDVAAVFKYPEKQAGALPVAINTLGTAVIMATRGGLWKTPPGDAFDGARLEPFPSVRHHVFALLDHPSGALLAHRGGIGLLQENGTVAPVYSSSNDVLVFAYDPAGESVVAAEGSHIVRVFFDGSATALTTLPDLAISMIALDSCVVIGMTSRGVAVLGESPANIRDLPKHLAHEIGPSFVATAGGAVIAVRGGTLVWLPSVSAPAETMSLVEGFTPTTIATKGKDVWIAGERKFSSARRLPLLYHFRHDDGTARVQSIAEDVLARSGTVVALHPQHEGAREYLWIGGEAAMIRIDLSGIRATAVPLPPILRLQSPSRSAKSSDLLLPYRGNRIEVDIAWPEPGRRSSLLLQTMLVGSDLGWSEPQDRTAIGLGNLQHGGYELRARFVTADGQVSPASVLPFRVAAPWWLNPWAVVAQSAVVLLIIIGVVKLRERGLRRHAENLERLVEQRTALLAHANQAKTEFVAKMSHELRNPLNGIVAGAHALEAQGMAGDQRELVSTMRQCAELLDALIGDVLDFSEIESGRITLRPTDFDPAQVASSARAMIAPAAQKKGLRIEAEVANGVPALVHGDPARVQQVILNLLSNAVKFSSEGAVRLRLASIDDANGGLLFTVSDEGPGVPAAERHLLFEKFARLSDAKQRNIPGTGLGLAVCRQLVERMGGSIWLEQGDTHGASFSFRLPLYPASASARTRLPAEPTLPRKVLIVEDLDYNTRAMVAMLTSIGCVTKTASDAATALARLATERFDAVFLDCDLPDLTGPELARAILALPNGFAPPQLIATTAYADEAMREMCVRAGMQGFIAKPVSPEKIRAVFSNSGTAGLLTAPSLEMPATIEPPKLDTRLLQAIAQDQRELRGQAGRLDQMMRTDLAILKATAERRDFVAMRSAAHRFVSHARFVGADRLAAMAGEIERSAREEPDAALEMVPVVEAEVVRVLQQLSTCV